MPPIGRAELELAGYVLARTLDGRAFSGRTVYKLQVATMAVKMTRDAFAFGRANVAIDTAQTEHRNWYGGEVARNIAEEVMAQVRTEGRSRSDFDDEYRYVEGAAGLLAGAGACGEHATVAAITLAPTLSPGEQANMVESTEEDHAWAEHELATTPIVPASARTSSEDTSTAVSAQQRDGRDSPIVLDAWSDGPPMKSSDTRLAKHRSQIFIKTSIPYEQGTRTRAMFDSTSILLHREWGSHVAALVDERKGALGKRPEDDPDHWESDAVVDPEFARRVRHLIDHGGRDEILRLATDVAEQVLGLSPEAAARAAPEVVCAAARLDEIGPARGIKPASLAGSAVDSGSMVIDTQER